MSHKSANKIPKVSIIIVNYNGYIDTVECIKSLKNIIYPDFNIIVVDNGSTQEIEDLKTYIKKSAILINQSKNLGFSGGNNIGIQYAIEHDADYVLLLNNDTTVEPEFLNILVNCAEEHRDSGIIGGKINYYNSPDTIWFGGGKVNKYSAVIWHEYIKEKDRGKKGKVRETQFLTGCLMLIPKTIVKKVGLLDESYFLYDEDVDYCFRVMRAGYKLYYCNDAVIYHKVSASSGNFSDLSQYYMVRNGLYTSKKYAKNKIYAYMFRTLRSIKWIFQGIYRIKPVWEGYRDFFRHKTGEK